MCWLCFYFRAGRFQFESDVYVQSDGWAWFPAEVDLFGAVLNLLLAHCLHLRVHFA